MSPTVPDVRLRQVNETLRQSGDWRSETECRKAGGPSRLRASKPPHSQKSPHSYLVSIVTEGLRGDQEEFARDTVNEEFAGVTVNELRPTRRLPFRPISVAPPRRSI